MPKPPTLEILPPNLDIRPSSIAAPSSEPIYSTATTDEVIRLCACPPGFKRVEPEHIPKLSWDELYQENLTLKHVLANASQEIQTLRSEIAKLINIDDLY